MHIEPDTMAIHTTQLFKRCTQKLTCTNMLGAGAEREKGRYVRESAYLNERTRCRGRKTNRTFRESRQIYHYFP